MAVKYLMIELHLRTHHANKSPPKKKIIHSIRLKFDQKLSKANNWKSFEPDFNVKIVINKFWDA